MGKAFKQAPEIEPERKFELIRAEEHGNIAVGAFWMVAVSLTLFFLPVVNGLIGGVVGGYVVGSIKRAIIAALVPAVLVAAGLWGLITAIGHPLMGMFAGLALGVWIVLSDIGLFLGAILGGALGAAKPRAKL